MSIIPTTDPSVASNRAKTYLKQYKSWLLVSLRQDSNHSEAIYQCKERLKVVEHVKGDDIASGIILDCRFIKQYSTKRTLTELKHHHIDMTERTLRYKQRKALLLAYDYLPTAKTNITRTI